MKELVLKKILPGFVAFSLIASFFFTLLYAGSMNVLGLNIGSKYTILIMVICSLLALAVGLYMYATKSNSYWLVTLMCFVISIPFLEMSLPIFLNCYFDNGYSKIVNAKIVDKEVVRYKTRQGFGYSYILKLDHSQSYVSFKNLNVSEDKYYLVKKDDWIEMDVRPGKLGYPWIRSFRAI